MKQHKWQPLNDDEISEILDKHGFNEVQIAGEYIDIVKLIRDVEKTHGIKPQPKTPKQAWDEELTRSYKETIIERLRNDDKFYDEVFSAYDNAKDNEIKPQPKEPQYLYVWNLSSKIIFTQDNNGVVIDTWDPKVLPKYLGKIKLEVEE